MDRLRVGSVEIDGSRVRIDSRNLPSALPVRPATAPVQASTWSSLEQLPVSARTMAIGGAVLVIIGALLFVSSGAPADILAFVLRGGLLSSFGLGVLGLGGLRLFSERVRATEVRERRRSNAERLSGQLVPLLSEPRPEQTIEWLTAQAGLLEAETLVALEHLRHRGWLREELDSETGRWFYWVAPQPDDLTSRLKRLNAEQGAADRER